MRTFLLLIAFWYGSETLIWTLDIVLSLGSFGLEVDLPFEPALSIPCLSAIQTLYARVNGLSGSPPELYIKLGSMCCLTGHDSTTTTPTIFSQKLQEISLADVLNVYKNVDD
jgi:hypothetical protein